MTEKMIYRGQPVEIGDGDELFKLTYQQVKHATSTKRLRQFQNGTPPELYLDPRLGYLFRFPFPDEANYTVQIALDEYKKRSEYVTIRRGEFFPPGRFSKRADVTFSDRSPYGHYRGKPYPNPNADTSSSTITLEVLYQMPIDLGDGVCTILIVRDPHTWMKQRIDDLPRLLHLLSELSNRYVQQARDRSERKFWQDMICLIWEGYGRHPDFKEELFTNILKP